MDTQIRGLHHVTAITSSAEKNYRFFTDILGLRMIKKTVNQDDIETYHLYFTDDTGAPGTDMTFFDFPKEQKEPTAFHVRAFVFQPMLHWSIGHNALQI